jgi:hypothetical protein
VVTTTVVLHGQIIIEGVKFLWWVTDGRPARITVSHPLHGTKTAQAEPSPEQQAKALARSLLDGAQSDRGVRSGARSGMPRG